MYEHFKGRSYVHGITSPYIYGQTNACAGRVTILLYCPFVLEQRGLKNFFVYKIFKHEFFLNFK